MIERRAGKNSVAGNVGYRQSVTVPEQIALQDGCRKLRQFRQFQRKVAFQYDRPFVAGVFGAEAVVFDRQIFDGSSGQDTERIAVKSARHGQDMSAAVQNSGIAEFGIFGQGDGKIVFYFNISVRSVQGVQQYVRRVGSNGSQLRTVARYRYRNRRQRGGGDQKDCGKYYNGIQYLSANAGHGAAFRRYYGAGFRRFQGFAVA